MTEILADDVIVSFWAIGPTYRQQLHKTIQDYLNNKLDKVFKFTILTDYVDDFKQLYNNTSECLAVLDIDQERSMYDWSFEYEAIPTAKTDQEYTAQFRSNLSNGKRFSYSLHRFALPWIIKNNYTKFVIIDPDVYFAFKSQDINTLQDYVNAYFLHGDAPSRTNEVDYVIASGYAEERKQVNEDYFNLLCKYTNSTCNMPEIFCMNDGPFRFYSFETVDKVEKFFNTWNTGVEMMLKEPECAAAHGPVFLNDEVLLGSIYSLLNIKVSPMNCMAAKILHRIENRYFMPTTGYYKLTDSLEEFLQVNHAELVEYYDNLGWIDVRDSLLYEKQ